MVWLAIHLKCLQELNLILNDLNEDNLEVGLVTYTTAQVSVINSDYGKTETDTTKMKTKILETIQLLKRRIKL